MNELTREDLIHFCGNLRYRLQLLAGSRRHTDRLLATRFNIFDYISPNENRLSDVIADLIDPHGKHGQGDAFLKEFVETVCGDRKPSILKFQSIQRERTTSLIANHLRRMDVLIDLDTFGVAIENKPWAGEQNDQIHDYVTHLDRRFGGNFVIVYLSSDGAEPTSIGADIKERLLEERRLILCAYRGRFLAWLTRCYRICTAEKIRWFLYDFMAFTEQTFPARNLAASTSEDE